MDKFYVFLDVDGVLNNDPAGWYDKIETSNVEVFNNFLVKLKEVNFDPVIVVSSNWRLYPDKFEKLQNTFSQLKLDYTGEYLKTEVGLSPVRGRQIGATLGKYNVENNFVIIDDNLDEIARYYPKYHIIEPSNGGLKQENIDNFFNNSLPSIIMDNKLSQKSNK